MVFFSCSVNIFFLSCTRDSIIFRLVTALSVLFFKMLSMMLFGVSAKWLICITKVPRPCVVDLRSVA